VKCRGLRKTLARLLAARSQGQECIASNMRGFSSPIASNVTKNVDQRTHAATTLNIANGVYSFSGAIRFVRLRDSAAALPNRLTPITSFQSKKVGPDSISRTDKALAMLATRTKLRQKTPIFLVTKGRGTQISTNRTL